jgi:hypothetical protein
MKDVPFEFIYHLAKFGKKFGEQKVQRLYFSNRSNFEYWKRFQSWIWASLLEQCGPGA